MSEGCGWTAGSQPVRRRKVQVHVGLLHVHNINTRLGGFNGASKYIFFTNCSGENTEKRETRGWTGLRSIELFISFLSTSPPDAAAVQVAILLG